MKNELTIEMLVRRVGSVASPPIVYTRLNKAMKRPNSSLREIGEIVSEDAVLTARLLRLVNSSFYSLKNKVETVSKAILLLGTQELQDLVLGTTVLSMFENVPENLVNMESFWRHSIACGIAAKEIAKQGRQLNLERFFVAGLLHDIGKLVIYMGASTSAQEVLARCSKDNELQHRVENDVLGYNHAQVGLALAKTWHLPDSYTKAIAFHHGPWVAIPEIAAVHIGDIIVNALQIGGSGEKFVQPLMSEAWKMLGVSEEAIPAIVRNIKQQVAEIVEPAGDNS
ncbi:MAG: HDOD domain-containing protein [Deltaproteobacteria bacterium]|nr:HDOD domain-containing protein [Deltaproteobacteria bacterium]